MMNTDKTTVTDSRTVASDIYCEHGIVAGYCAECDGSTPDVAKFNAAVNPDDKYLADSCGKNNHTDSRTVASETYEPENLKLWTMPSNYFGESWPATYVFLGQHRDSDALARSNFKCGLEAIGGESETVTVVRESHWAVGWVEWIAIHQDDSEALRIADEIKAKLDDYPVVDENDYSETEMNEANEIWQSCYDSQERVEYIREHRSQFDFNGLADLLACVRGKYFAGYASELLN